MATAVALLLLPVVVLEFREVPGHGGVPEGVAPRVRCQRSGLPRSLPWRSLLLCAVCVSRLLNLTLCSLVIIPAGFVVSGSPGFLAIVLLRDGRSPYWCVLVARGRRVL
jgi:hypothetical protein